MSRTTQFVSIPLKEGLTTAPIASTVFGVGGAELKDGKIFFQAGPDLIGAMYLPCNVLVQETSKPVPEGYEDAGEIAHNNRNLKVLVAIPRHI